jgi:hypothetical protein
MLGIVKRENVIVNYIFSQTAKDSLVEGSETEGGKGWEEAKAN